MGAFDMDVEGDNPEVSVPKKSRTASLTIPGKWGHVRIQTAMMHMRCGNKEAHSLRTSR